MISFIYLINFVKDFLYKSSSYKMTIVPSEVKYNSMIIFLHGVGESGDTWEDTLRSICHPKIKIICPSAPEIRLTYKGIITTAWFDVYNKIDSENKSSILCAVDKIHKILDEELAKTGLPSENCMLAGFSQGGALALYAAFAYNKNLAGILSLSSWIPLRKTLTKDTLKNTDIPILHCYGMDDRMLDQKVVNETSDILSKINSKYQFIGYEGLKHCTNEKVLTDMKAFIHKTLDLKCNI